MENWIDNQIENLYSLKDLKVIHWTCIEVALRENPIEWSNSKIPYLQCMRIDILLDNHEIESLVTYQDADEWGLYLQDQSPKINFENEPKSIFRSRDLPELPKGIITNVNVITNNTGNIHMLLLEIDNNLVSFKAGEVYENTDGSLFIREMDESILVQLNAKKP